MYYCLYFVSLRQTSKRANNTDLKILKLIYVENTHS